jgi:hypothetical protein
MKLDSLRVIHISKASEQAKLVVSKMLVSHSFYSFETCQRWVWVCDQSVSWRDGLQVMQGQEAYCFLLRWACGLESEIVGETDIFGQIKEVWRNRVQAQAQESEFSGISFWMQKVFEDTKEIRSQYLQNLGGSSYGTLVRKWIKDSRLGEDVGGKDGKRSIFLVGAGQIAQSIAPALLDLNLILSNRDPSRLDALYSHLTTRNPSAPLLKITGRQEEQRAWQEASHTVLCIPQDSAQDRVRVQWFQQAQNTDRWVLHLGVRGRDRGVWGALKNFACLDDLFVLQKSLGHLRTAQIARAEKACDERAKLRALGTSLSLPHGWEDLACFG